MNNKINYSLTLRANTIKPELPAKAYPNIQLNSVLDINGLAAHIHEHNTVFSKGIIVGVLTDMCGCLKECLQNGSAVKLGELGRFDPSLISEGSVATAADPEQGIPAKTAMENFTADLITGLGVNFTPGVGLEFNREDMEFEFAGTRAAQAAIRKAEKKGTKQADWDE